MASKKIANGTSSKATGVDSIETGMALLTVLAELGRPQMLKTIAEHVGMPPSKAHRYLASFAKTGFVARDAENGRYTLGPAAIQAGLAALHGIEGVRLAIDIAAALRDTFDHTAVVSIWGSRGPAVVHLEESSDSRTYVKAGTVIPLISSASGHAFAALLPERTVMPLLKKELKVNGKRGDDRLISNLEQATKVLADFRKTGLGCVKGEMSPGIHALAAPVRDRAGYPVAVVAIMGMSEAFDSGLRGDVAALLRKLTADASRQLGYSAAASPG